ncbi:MAG: hypothetical protein J0H29_03505 [Sphingobacteriales bacterium]|nr:hypothetical protein [Sphingobacteriales bacterium]OJY87241.1 MAG: hypothetical protein BGP14_09000 [Sphingobacteriales bacterium 44-15]
MRLVTEKFEILSGGNIYQVRATEYLNGQEKLRYRVSVNDSPVCVFGWNNDRSRFTIMHDHRNPDIPGEIEQAIAGRLKHISRMKEAA